MFRQYTLSLTRFVLSLVVAVIVFAPVLAQDPTPAPTSEPLPNCPAFESQPDEQRVAYYMGEGSAFLIANRYEEARFAFTCVIRVIDSNYVPAYMGRGEIYIRTRRLENAIEDFTRASQLETGTPYALNNRGVAFALLGDPVRAALDFDRALEIDPNYLQAVNNRALLYTIEGDYEAAIALVNNAIDVTGVDQVLAEVRNPERPDDAPRFTVNTPQALLYGLLGTIRSAQALDEYRAYLDLMSYSGAGVDDRIASAASALDARFTFDFRLDDGSLLQLSPFPQNS
jgi:tetratricopeptide (TPR) repeat protein